MQEMQELQVRPLGWDDPSEKEMATHPSIAHASTQSCPALCNPMDCKAPLFVGLILLQARTLGWFAIFSSRVSSPPRDKSNPIFCVSCVAGGFFTCWAIGEAFNILAWEIPQTEETGRIQSLGSQRVRHNLAAKQQQQLNNLCDKENLNEN